MSIERRVDKKTGKITYIGRVYVGTKNGSVKLRSKSCTREKDAREFVAKYTNFKKNTVDKTVSDKTLFSAVFIAYLLSASQSKKDNTIKNYKQTFKKWIEPRLGDIQIGNISHLMLIRYFSLIRNEGASEYVVNYVHILLYEVFKFSTNSLETYIIENPMDGMERPKLEYSPTDSIKFWDKKSAEKLLKASMGSDYYLYFTLMINTGIRISEAAAITKDSFDFNRGVLNITSQLTNYVAKNNEEVFERGRFTLSQTKNKTARSIPLNKNAMEVAKILIEKNKDNYFLLSPCNRTKEHEVIVKRGAKAHVIKAQILGARTLGNALKKYSDLAKVEHIGPHGLRHSFAANFLMNGGDIFTLSRILGHKNINSTQIYSHLTSNYLKSAMNIVEFGG